MQVRIAWFDAASGTALLALAWCTLAVHAVLMIALTWRWAFAYETCTIFGAAMLSALMMGFLGAAATVVLSLGRPAQFSVDSGNEQQDALLLFPSEDSGTSGDDFAANGGILAPSPLATRRKALL